MEALFWSARVVLGPGREAGATTGVRRGVFEGGATRASHGRDEPAVQPRLPLGLR